MAPIPVTSPLYGAKCDGQADDGPAINAAAIAAVKSGAYAIALPGGRPCHSTTETIDIPNGVAIHSFGYGGSQTPAIGAVIQCAISTPTICVQTHDNSADGTHTFGGQTWANSSLALVVAGAYDSGKFGGTLAGGETVSCTATGPVQMAFAGAGVALCSWTPTLLINGSSAGVIQSVTRGSWQLDGDDMKAWFFITLSAVSGSGSVTISGLPNPCSSTIGAAGSGVGSYAGGAGLRGGLVAVPNAGASTILKTSRAAASVPLTQANLTPPTTVQGYTNCPL